MPLGNRIATSILGRRQQAAATAPPVSPDVATRTVRGLRSRRERHSAENLAPTSLNAAVGPWNSSRKAASSRP